MPDASSHFPVRENALRVLKYPRIASPGNSFNPKYLRCGYASRFLEQPRPVLREVNRSVASLHVSRGRR